MTVTVPNLSSSSSNSEQQSRVVKTPAAAATKSNLDNYVAKNRNISSGLSVSINPEMLELMNSLSHGTFPTSDSNPNNKPPSGIDADGNIKRFPTGPPSGSSRSLVRGVAPGSQQSPRAAQGAQAGLQTVGSSRAFTWQP